ncbi:MAG: DJ-1/PfpI family protein [Myxococcales bacterium]|nr:DJ-1/PfpI family protein [Myxococcales bacterium]
MQIRIFVFQGFTALDAVGPYEVLSRLPGADVRFVSQQPGEIRTDTGRLGLTADLGMADVSSADILLVAGGNQLPHESDEALMDWLRQIHATTTVTASVCTGALLLGAAGILQGKQATTYWARLNRLTDMGATPVEQRWVRDGKVWCAAGVSAGIDMALALTAELTAPQVAQALQLGIEYDPAPPFDAGSPAKAGEAITQLVRASLEG